VFWDLALILLGEYEKQRDFGFFRILLAQIKKANFVAFLITQMSLLAAMW
jgi:hypothetical protein